MKAKITRRVCIVLVALGTLMMAIACLAIVLGGAVAAAATRALSIEAGALVAFAMILTWSFGLKLAKASLDVYFETRKKNTDA